MSSFFSAAKSVMSKAATAAMDTHVAKTIQSTIDSHKVLDVRAGKWRDPGRNTVADDNNNYKQQPMSHDLVPSTDTDTNTTASTATSPTTTPTVAQTTYRQWHSSTTPVGTVAVEIHGLQDSSPGSDDDTTTDTATPKRVRRGTKYYAVVFLEGQRHTTGQLQNLDQQASLPHIIDDNGQETTQDVDALGPDGTSTGTKADSDITGQHQCTLNVRDVTSDVFVQVWSTRGRIGKDTSRSTARGHVFIGQAVVPLRRLCPHMASSSSDQTHRMDTTTLSLWPLDPDDVKLQSGLSKLKGSAMKRPVFSKQVQTNVQGKRGGVKVVVVVFVMVVLLLWRCTPLL